MYHYRKHHQVLNRFAVANSRFLAGRFERNLIVLRRVACTARNLFFPAGANCHTGIEKPLKPNRNIVIHLSLHCKK